MNKSLLAPITTVRALLITHTLWLLTFFMDGNGSLKGGLSDWAGHGRGGKVEKRAKARCSGELFKPARNVTDLCTYSCFRYFVQETLMRYYYHRPIFANFYYVGGHHMTHDALPQVRTV